MTPAEYRRELDRAHLPVVALLTAILRALPIPPSSAQWAQLLRVMFPVVLAARAQAVTVAAQLHADASAGEAVPDLPDPHYSVQALDDALTRSARTRLVEDGPARETIVRAATHAVGRHVDMAARTATVVAVHDDKDAIGWARVLTGVENCAFCIALASRGPMYGSRKAAGGYDTWHDGCDCMAVPVFNRDAWPGRDTYLAAKRLYAEGTRGAKSGDQINALRRHMNKLAEDSSSAAA